MRNSIVLFQFFIIGALSTVLVADEPPSSKNKPVKLELHRVLPVNGPKRNQPSGLTISDGTLYAVSDKHDDTIFSVELTDSYARMKPAYTFKVKAKGYLDFEGLTCDAKGNFYIASEAKCRIIKVAPKSKTGIFVSPDLRPYGKKQGLFKVKNAFFEGIACRKTGVFMLAVERQPRGLLQVDIRKKDPAVTAWNCDSSRFDFRKDRPYDFAGLFFYQNTLYALQRNAYLISEIKCRPDGFTEGGAWSYGHVIHQKKFMYAVMRYGMAEGFCMDRKFVYVILDNNEVPRLHFPKDRRPLLLILKNPLSAAKLPEK